MISKRTLVLAYLLGLLVLSGYGRLLDIYRAEARLIRYGILFAFPLTLLLTTIQGRVRLPKSHFAAVVLLLLYTVFWGYMGMVTYANYFAYADTERMLVLILGFLAASLGVSACEEADIDRAIGLSTKLALPFALIEMAFAMLSTVGAYYGAGFQTYNYVFLFWYAYGLSRLLLSERGNSDKFAQVITVVFGALCVLRALKPVFFMLLVVTLVQILLVRTRGLLTGRLFRCVLAVVGFLLLVSVADLASDGKVSDWYRYRIAHRVFKLPLNMIEDQSLLHLWRISRHQERDLSGHRVMIWEHTLEDFRESPVFGFGLGYRVALSHDDLVGNHSLYLHILLVSGGLGVVVVFLCLVPGLRAVTQNFDHLRRDRLRMAMFSYIVGTLMYNMVGIFLGAFAFCLTFVVAFAIALHLATLESQRQKQFMGPPPGLL